MFEHLETTAVETFTTPGELLDEKTWHRDVLSIIDYFFRINKDDADLKHICLEYQGLQYMMYIDLTLYYERCGILPAHKRKVVEHIVDTLNKYHDASNVIPKNSVDAQKGCIIMPFKEPDTKSH